MQRPPRHQGYICTMVDNIRSRNDWNDQLSDDEQVNGPICIV